MSKVKPRQPAASQTSEQVDEGRLSDVFVGIPPYNEVVAIGSVILSVQEITERVLVGNRYSAKGPTGYVKTVINNRNHAVTESNMFFRPFYLSTDGFCPKRGNEQPVGLSNNDGVFTNGNTTVDSDVTSEYGLLSGLTGDVNFEINRGAP